MYMDNPIEKAVDRYVVILDLWNYLWDLFLRGLNKIFLTYICMYMKSKYSICITCKYKKMKIKLDNLNLHKNSYIYYSLNFCLITWIPFFPGRHLDRKWTNLYGESHCKSRWPKCRDTWFLKSLVRSLFSIFPFCKLSTLAWSLALIKV